MEGEKEILENLKKAVIAGDEESAKKISEAALSIGMDPMVAVRDGLIKGMSAVGEKFAKSEMLVAEVMLSADAMKAAMAVLEPKIAAGKLSEITLGKIVIGTVKGDIHDIGKNIVSTLLGISGFKIYDMGADVPPNDFVEKAGEVDADIIAMSALLSTTMPFQQELIKVLNDMGLRDKYKVLVGGAPVTPEWARKIGADGYGSDAFEAIKEAKRLVMDRK